MMNRKQLNQIFKILLLNSTIIVCCTLFNLVNVFSQPVSIGTSVSEYLRLMNIRGQLNTNASWNLQPLQYDWFQKQQSEFIDPWKDIISVEMNRRKNYASGIQLYFYPISFFQSYNTQVPAGGNDGALWQGRGYNSSFTSGLWLKFKFLEVSLQPELFFSQNKDFVLSPFTAGEKFSVFREPITIIDTPQKFGDESFSGIDLGDSFIQLITGPIAIGFSNAHQWLSPSVYNPIMMSNNGPGFKHVYLKTSDPVKTPLGYFESRIFLGGLKESKYFDFKRKNNLRLITAFYFSYSPSFLKNLSFGVSRTYYETWPIEGIELNDVTRLFSAFYKESYATEENPEGNDQADQIFSYFMRWVFPKKGNEIYFELVRNDHAWDYRDFILEIEHATAFTIGGISTKDLTNQSFLKFNFEITKLENPKTGSFRGFPTLYAHNFKNGGYAQNGQVIGAKIGPGSNSQIINIDYYDKWGKINLFANRIVHNNDQLYLRIRTFQGYPGNDYSLQYLHNVEIRLGLGTTKYINNIAISMNIWGGKEFNRYNIYANDQFNFNISSKLRYSF